MWRTCAFALPVLAVAACGGSSKTTPATATSRTTLTETNGAPASATTPSPSGGSSAVTSAGIHASLHALNHSPVVNRGWPYTVIATDASAHPLTGTVTVQFVFAGQVVGRDTPPTHPLKNGHWHDLLRFPARAAGIPLTFETVVRTPLGTVTLSWPVKAKP